MELDPSNHSETAEYELIVNNDPTESNHSYKEPITRASLFIDEKNCRLVRLIKSHLDDKFSSFEKQFFNKFDALELEKWMAKVETLLEIRKQNIHETRSEDNKGDYSEKGPVVSRSLRVRKKPDLAGNRTRDLLLVRQT